jgi:hypothetical protein
MSDKPATESEVVISKMACETFEKRIQDSIKLKVAQMFAECVSELMNRTKEEIGHTSERGG